MRPLRVYKIHKSIHKSGGIEEPTNFRPINLLPILSKILEKVMSTQLTEYLENNNLLNESQYAYRNNSSTEQALVNVTKQIYKSIDKGKISLHVLLDLSNYKAFDSVNHDLLLNKLVQLNIDSTWFASYLHYRTHSVNIDKITFEAQSNLYGVPQVKYLVQSSLTFLSMTSLKLIHYQKLQLVQPFMQTMFNSCSVAHLIISSS